MARKSNDGRGRLGGRVKGTPNKTTKEVRDLFSDFCIEKMDDFVANYERILNPKERCEVYIKAAQFVAPKPLAVDMDLKSSSVDFRSELDKMAEEEEK